MSASEEWQAQGNVREETSKVSGPSKRCARSFAWLLLVLAITGLFSHGSFYVKGSDGASSSIGEAGAAIRQAFNATLDAERAGANVSGLIVRLNEAGSLLTMAEVAYGNGNLSGAVDLAGQSLRTAYDVKDDALKMKDSAAQNTHSLIVSSVIFWASGASGFTLLLILVWVWFKRFYARRLPKLKPEVVSDAED